MLRGKSILPVGRVMSLGCSQNLYCSAGNRTASRRRDKISHQTLKWLINYIDIDHGRWSWQRSLIGIWNDIEGP